MKPALLSMIHCIFCESSLSIKDLRSSNGNEIMEATLCCNACETTYPVTRGVPRLLSQQISKETDLHTGEKFTVSWKKFSRLDSRYFKQFFDWTYPVSPSDFVGKTILEAGCGKGRHTEIAVQAGAAQVVAVDIGDVVDVAFDNVGHLENVHIVQSDINALPFAPIFDLAFSVGVLHHMQNPRSGFDSMTKQVKPGGTVCVWVYGRENNGWIVNVVSPLREAITSKLPEFALSLLTRMLTIPLFLLSKLVMRPYDQLQSNNKWLPELFYQKYLAYIGAFDFNEVEHIVFDHLIAPVAYYIPRSEVESWFNNRSFSKQIIRWHNKNSWTACATISGTPADQLSVSGQHR